MTCKCNWRIITIKWNVGEEAERRYKLAQCMCPSRFLPLQGLLRVYVKSDNCILAERIAFRNNQQTDKDTILHCCYHTGRGQKLFAQKNI